MNESEKSVESPEELAGKFVATVRTLERIAEDEAREKARDEEWAKAVREQAEVHAEWRAAVAVQSEVFLLIAECLVELAAPVSPDAGNRRSRYEALALLHRDKAAPE